MNTIDRPAFASPELQAALEEAYDTLEGADDARNRVSQDIKALEGYLASLRLTPPFRYPLGKGCVAENEQYLAASLELGGSASGRICEEALVFGKDANGKVRVLYEFSEWEGSIDVDVPGGPYFWDDSTHQVEVKPLIETKFEIRKEMYEQLPAFVKALSKHYAISPKKLSEVDTEIPF